MSAQPMGLKCLAVLVSLAWSGLANAQANCALRNPDRQIFEIFPDASSYRTITATVNDSLKGVIEDQVGSGLSQTDLGMHTVYLVLREAAPIGFVHARAEVGTRGSVELVWALDLDLKLKDFRVQRSRERNTESVESVAFRERLVGRDLDGIRALLTSGNNAVNLSALGVSANAASIARTVVVCALKTRLITEAAFGQTIHAARMLGHMHRAFPQTVSITRTTAGEGAVESALAGIGGDPPVEVKSCTLLQSTGPADEPLGSMVFARLTEHPDTPETWWFVGSDLAILEVRVVGGGGDLEAEFGLLVGTKLDDLASPPAGASEMVVRCAQFIRGLLYSG